MIYVDVTAACLLPLQSGIPRMTRGIYRLLNEHLPEEIIPVFWQPFRGCYTKLSARSRMLLEDPFFDSQSKRVPRDSTIPLLWASFSDLVGRWPQAMPLHAHMRAGDTLLLTAILPDNRLPYLQRLTTSSPGRKIAVFHDAIPLHDPNVAGWEKSRHIQTLQLLSQMDLVITVSRAAEKDLQALWLEHGLIARTATQVIPWPTPFTTQRPFFSEPSSEKKKILYVSRFKQVKNHATLFAACEKLWRDGVDFSLDLIGCEDEARESRQIVKEIMRLQNEDRSISWRGHVTDSELHAAYQSATFTVFPSLMEGFGLPIVESFWHGRAVVCSDRDAMGELSREGGCLTTDVRDPSAMAVAIQTLLQDRMKCFALSKEAYSRPLRTWSDYWQELKPILENR
jgi:glycosyltransferase involved in cell wall biosynthesis